MRVVSPENPGDLLINMNDHTPQYADIYAQIWSPNHTNHKRGVRRVCLLPLSLLVGPITMYLAQSNNAKLGLVLALGTCRTLVVTMYKLS